ncbi:unnamed protein product [Cuscuta epithymum]|uniref:Cellulose synthase-like protein H1 n=1 Tax=Cuscuta epithymum TaxID=186058 RepID=A0AAV0FNF4_9ASTE|nr:unnamed protein product [Cuscuta epithymum]
MAPNQSPQSFPLYETKFRNNKTSRAIEVVILGLLISLITYRFHFLNSHGYYLPWIIALLCESWFTFVWILNINAKWNQMETKTYPERLLKRMEDGTAELPALDMFVTTADSELEPPILTMNTVLSLLALDYPTKKLSCYVSDDGASPVTFYSLVEATKFAKSWVPFCKKFNVAVRAPFQYFSNGNPTCPQHDSSEFQHEWEKMKEEYSILCGKIEDASEKTIFDLTGEFLAFAKIERRDHSPIIKVIWENKEAHHVSEEDGVPSIIYISREKRPKHPHHYKAGAMNVLTRVSGVMTNAPFMINVDCDCYANDPKVALRAMCLLLGAEDETDAGFVQFPQSFYGALKDDPFGNQLKVLMKVMGAGIAGIQGPFYQGTGCFHRRKVVYGLFPNRTDVSEKWDGKEEIWARFGKSKALVSSAAKTLSSGSFHPDLDETSLSSSSLLETATHVAKSNYEFGTGWGHDVGWIYGSATEDILTGLAIHSRGWKSAYCDTNPPAFLGCAPTGGPEALIQQKRWAGGLMEIVTSKSNPIISTAFRRLKFRQCLGYLWIMIWPVRPIFEILYSLLPAYCIISNSSFHPKASEAAIIVPASIFIVYNLHTLSEYIRCGESTRAWWNNQRMLKINASGAWLFGFLSGVFKVLGFSDTMFEVTKKDFSGDESLEKEKSDAGRFTFDDSPLFIPGTTILLVNVAALFIGFLDFERRVWGLGEVICSIWVGLMYWAFLKGLFGKGKYGIPFSTILKSGALALVFVQASKFPY